MAQYSGSGRGARVGAPSDRAVPATVVGGARRSGIREGRRERERTKWVGDEAFVRAPM